MLILKFGGTSVRDAERLRNAAAIVDARRDGGAVVVVSAAAGMTRRLLDLATAAARGPLGEVEAEVAAIQALQHGIVDDLQLGVAARERVMAKLRALFGELREVVSDLAAARPDATAQDLVMSFGERFSSTLMVAAAEAAGLPVEPVSALDVIVTDATFRNAAPDRAAINRRAARRIAPLLRDARVVVTEGFIGATVEGMVTTMGFEASDLTAALLGAAVDAEQVQIWTDVPGMLTTGHATVPEPRRVPRLTYDEAAELALFGARVLHPETVAPARDKGIPVRILHAADPAGEGTWITDEGPLDDGRPTVRAIAVAADADDDSFATVRELLDRTGAGQPGDRGVVCPVGRGIGEATEIVERIERLLAGIPSTPLQPRRPHAIPLVVSRRRIDDVVRRLHAALLAP